MHMAMLRPAEISNNALRRFDVKIRQGTGGLPLIEGERVRAEIGHSAMAYIAVTEEEMRRLPLRNPTMGFKPISQTTVIWYLARCLEDKVMNKSPFFTISAIKDYSFQP